MTDFETKQFSDEAAFKAALLYSKAYARGHANGFYAYASLEATPHQCTGRDCGRAAALQYARDMGWVESRFLDEVPDASLTEEELD